MCKCVGIVAEFNPFHNGHATLAEFARHSGASHVVAVMSGNAVQRGSFAICDKRIRTHAALISGIDLVLELPLPYAVSSAETFASGAVSVLKASGCVDTLCFGSESGDIKALENLSRILDDDEFKNLTQSRLAEGVTFARARREAAEIIYGAETAEALSSPNNILAVEYLRSMRRQNWDSSAMTMKRAGTKHDSDAPSGMFASASYLREFSGDMACLREYVPEQAMRIYNEARENGLFPADAKKLETAVLSTLRRLSITDLKALPDISEGLENRLYAAIRSQSSLDGLLMAVKTKRYTLARIRRLVLSAFLGVRAADTAILPPYARILGFNEKGRELLADIKAHGNLPAHTSLAKLEKLSPECARLAELEARCTDQFSLMLPKPLPCGFEYTAKAIVIQ